MEGKQPESSVYYVLGTLSSQKLKINSQAETMLSSRLSVEKYLTADKERAKDHYDALIRAREKLIECIQSSVLCLYETGEEKLAAYGATLSGQIKDFNLMTNDYSTLIKVLEDYADRLPELTTTNASIIGRCMNSVRMGHYPTDLENVAHIMNGIAFPEGVTTNLLDPCCGEGDALKKLAVGNNCFTYGVELDESRAEAAQETLHRVGFGSFFHSRISHEAFHVVFLNPPYLSVLNEGGTRSRDEKRFLIDSIPHLMPGGLLVYIIPYYRLTSDICRILCDNLEGISVHRFTEKEFRKFSQVAVMGTRTRRRDGSEAADRLAAFAYRPDELPCVTELEPKRYALPAFAKKVDIFKGAMFNVAELQRQLKQSGSFDSIMATKQLESGVRRPPLPFSFSQLGLIGGSGLINGLIDCEYPHVIKGRIVKQAKKESTENRGSRGQLISTEYRETISNKMVFNILTPEGFKSLT